jgi:hypothetical protein
VTFLRALGRQTFLASGPFSPRSGCAVLYDAVGEHSQLARHTLTLPMAQARGCSAHRRDPRPGALAGLPGSGGQRRLGGGVAAQALVIVWQLIQGAFVLLPTGTAHRRMPPNTMRLARCNVSSSPILAPASATGTGGEGHASPRLQAGLLARKSSSTQIAARYT